MLFSLNLQGLDILMLSNQVTVYFPAHVKTERFTCGLTHGTGFKKWLNSQICCICIYLQVMDKDLTLEQDMEKEVCLNRNEVIS